MTMVFKFYDGFQVCLWVYGRLKLKKQMFIKYIIYLIYKNSAFHPGSRYIYQ